MNVNVYQIRDLYAYTDGDCITPSMGVSIDAGYSLAQYWDTTLKKIVNTDFTAHNAKLYPQAYSSLEGKIIVPESGSWHIGSPTASALTFDSNGNCTTSGYTSTFKKSTIIVNSVTLPCLIICGNLCSATDLNTKHIYYVGSYNGMDFTCHQEVLVQVAMADAYDVILSLVSPGGDKGENVNGDNVISNKEDWVQITPYMTRGGVQVAGATYKWDKLVNGVWTTLTTTDGFTEIGSNGVIKIFEGAVEGIEYFRVTATLGTSTARKTIDIADTSDPYYLDDGCSTSAGVKSGETVTFTPKVYVRSTNQEDTQYSWSFAFTVTKAQSGDVLMTANTTLKLTYDAIKSYGGRVKVQTRAYHS